MNGRDSLTRSHRTLRDGSFIGRIPGNKLPGYLHSVPTGLSPLAQPGRIVNRAIEVRADLVQLEASVRSGGLCAGKQRSDRGIIQLLISPDCFDGLL